MQSTLSHKLQQCPEMEACVDLNANALSSKRPCIVTNPDVERALQVWVQQMERKGEFVNSGMLIVNKDEMGVPEDERLHGNGWVQKFCNA